VSGDDLLAYTLEQDARFAQGKTEGCQPEPIGARRRLLEEKQGVACDPDQAHDQMRSESVDYERFRGRRQPTRVPGRLDVPTDPATEWIRELASLTA
jgi:hypothetical protein